MRRRPTAAALFLPRRVAWLALLCLAPAAGQGTPSPTAFPFQDDLVAYYNLTHGVVAGSHGGMGGGAFGNDGSRARGVARPVEARP